MASVLIMGASRGIGFETTQLALAAGHSVRAMARSPGPDDNSASRLEKVSGDALSNADVEAALSGVDVVIQTLGVSTGALFGPVTLFSRATRILVDIMKVQGPRRLITVTGFGAGSSKASVSCLQRVPFELVLGRAYTDKDFQERIIQDSGLDWTIVRPGVLTDGRPTGRYRVLVEPSDWRFGFISRADVAEFLVRQIEDQSLIHEMPVLID